MQGIYKQDLEPLKNQCGSVPQRETMAQEIMKETAQVSELAASISERLEMKLASVMMVVDRPNDEKVGKLVRTYPPLFSEWREHIMSIRRNLENIDDCIRRTEL